MNPNMTVVHLLNVPIENDYKHTFYFESKQAQESYFLSRAVKTFTDFSYQRKDSIIRVPLPYDEIANVNYVMYKNAYYSDKWFYAFVTDIEYMSDGRTDLHIETDELQTWLFDYSILPSFVEREHVSTDNPGEHLIDEGLQLGDYVCNMHTKAGYDGVEPGSDATKLAIIVGTTQKPDGSNVRGTLYNNIYSGIRYFWFSNTMAGATALREWLDGFSSDGANSAITCMFLAPEKLVGSYDTEGFEIAGTNTVDRFYINHNAGTSNETETNFQISANNLNGYVPRNKKLLTYPYRFLNISNNNGIVVPYRYEDFYELSNNTKTYITPKFVIEGVLTPGCSVRMIPENYKGVDRNDEEGINLGKFPALNWNSDYFTNWLTQNAVNMGVSVATDVAQIGVGALSFANPIPGDELGGASLITSGVSGIVSTLGEVYKAHLTPPQSHGNVNCGDVVTASGNNDFHFYDMSIRSNYAKILDRFFDVYGYKINKIKVPNRVHRSIYWYTKTKEANIGGNIPMIAKNKIKMAYDNGITFWRVPVSIKNYNLVNGIDIGANAVLDDNGIFG